MNKRVTFVIGTDGKLVDVISSETNMDVHADKALEALRAVGLQGTTPTQERGGGSGSRSSGAPDPLLSRTVAVERRNLPQVDLAASPRAIDEICRKLNLRPSVSLSPAACRCR